MSIGKHTLANVTGAAVPLLITFATVPLYLRLIGAERYGVLAVIWALLGYFGFFDFGLGRATAQRMARLESSANDERCGLLWTAILLTAVLGIIGGVVLWLSANSLLIHVISITDENRMEALGAIPWLVLALPLLLVTSAMNGALQGRERFVAINAVGIVGNILNQLMPLMVAWLGHQGLEFLVPAALSGRLFSSFLLFIQCRKYVPLHGMPRIDRAHLKPLANYGGWVSLISMLAPMLVTIDRLMIGAISGAKSVAYYTVPYSVVSYLMILSGSLASALFPRLAAAQPEDAYALATHSTQILVGIMTPVVIVTLAVVHPFLILWVGEKFADRAAGVSEIILLGVWLNSFVIPHNARLQAEGRLKTILGIYLCEIPLYFFMLWKGLEHWGIAGAAAAWSLRVAMDTVLLLWASGALKQTLSGSLPATVLVALAALITFETDPASLWRVFGTSLLLAMSIYLGRKQISGVGRTFVWWRAMSA